MVIIVAGFLTDWVESQPLCFCAAIVIAVNPPHPHPPTKKEGNLVYWIHPLWFSSPSTLKSDTEITFLVVFTRRSIKCHISAVIIYLLGDEVIKLMTCAAACLKQLYVQTHQLPTWLWTTTVFDNPPPPPPSQRPWRWQDNGLRPGLGQQWELRSNPEHQMMLPAVVVPISAENQQGQWCCNWNHHRVQSTSTSAGRDAAPNPVHLRLGGVG